ncbi:hypothetical protein BCO26_2109 [Heyndrickxia coagulans 2-6]|nr:hypothetical protein BCO26_2109 [Heyndrickxia coagulans 2-6]
MKWMAGRKQFDVFVLYFLVSGTMRQEIQYQNKKARIPAIN